MREYLGMALDIILLGIALEAVVLWLAGRLRLHMRAVMDWLPNLAAGFLLMLAIRLTLLERYDIVMALILPASLGVHLLDLRGRLRPERRDSQSGMN